MTHLPSPRRAGPPRQPRHRATKLRHEPASLALTLGAPVVLVIIFGYIFGSAIKVPGHASYREYLVPGLYVLIAANILPPMVTMARDSTRGAVDRFRSLPINRAAVPFGQAAATPSTGWPTSC